jgi:hypothetical protein
VACVDEREWERRLLLDQQPWLSISVWHGVDYDPCDMSASTKYMLLARIDPVAKRDREQISRVG